MGLARRNVEEIRPYVPGKPVEEVRRELGLSGNIIKLASNENPLGPSPLAVKAMRKALKRTHFYPEDGAYYLTRALARRHGVGEDQILIANGSVEVMYYLTTAFANPGESVAMNDQAFILYRIVTKVADARRIAPPLKNYTHDLAAIALAIEPDTKVVFIANPNNPTGTMNTQEEAEEFMAVVPPNVIVVWDEAYREYIDRPDYPDTMRYIREGRNVVILRTFSKIFGLAGLRVGYAIGKPEIIAALRKVRVPFNVATLGQEGCLAALDDEAHIQRSKAMNAEGREFLYKAFDRLGIFHVPSVANFVYVDVGRDSLPVFQALQREGVIIRPIKEYDFPNSFRASVGTPRQNRKLIRALKKVLKG